jgi:hypothetical protein
MSERSRAALWILLLTATSIATTIILACAMPFAALAALAAKHLRRQEGVPLTLLVWGTSQAIGFGLLHYPHDPATIAWGLGMGVAALAALFSGYAVNGRMGNRSALARIGLAYLAAFVAFKAVLLLCSVGLGGTRLALSPPLMLRLFAQGGMALLGLLALFRALVMIGVPAPPARLQAA